MANAYKKIEDHPGVSWRDGLLHVGLDGKVWPLGVLARKNSLTYGCLHSRLLKGMTALEALTKPVIKRTEPRKKPRKRKPAKEQRNGDGRLVLIEVDTEGLKQTLDVLRVLSPVRAVREIYGVKEDGADD